MNALSAKTRARHIALLHHVAELAEEHNLPVLALITAPARKRDPFLLCLDHRDWRAGPTWARLLGLGAGTAFSCEVKWTSPDFHLSVARNSPAEAERLAAEDGAA